MEDDSTPTRYEFVIKDWSPSTIPMRRLAQYLEKLSALSGHPDRVHFEKVVPGSVKPVFQVERFVAPAVLHRFHAANDGTIAEAVAIGAEINRMLRQDNTWGALKVYRGPNIVQFPGIKVPLSEEVSVVESTELDGVLIRIGGRDSSVPVGIESEGVYLRANTTRDLAKALAPHIFEGVLRFFGSGKWTRGADGVWKLETFNVSNFEVLDGKSLKDFVSDMRSVKGSGWNAMSDPHAELKRFRED